jgi:hypothetical protein
VTQPGCSGRSWHDLLSIGGGGPSRPDLFHLHLFRGRTSTRSRYPASWFPFRREERIGWVTAAWIQGCRIFLVCGPSWTSWTDESSVPEDHPRAGPVDVGVLRGSAGHRPQELPPLGTGRFLQGLSHSPGSPGRRWHDQGEKTAGWPRSGRRASAGSGPSGRPWAWDPSGPRSGGCRQGDSSVMRSSRPGSPRCAPAKWCGWKAGSRTSRPGTRCSSGPTGRRRPTSSWRAAGVPWSWAASWLKGGFARSVVKALEEKGAVVVQDEEVLRDPFRTGPSGAGQAHPDPRTRPPSWRP